MRKPFQFSITKRINAPLGYAFAWCTDFREDDHKISQQKRRIRILERTRKRFIMSIQTKHGLKGVSAVRIVSLNPPNSWHLDWIGDENNETGDYQLTRLGPRKTQLKATFKVKPKTSNTPTKPTMMKTVNSVWDKYVNALENDYKTR